MVVPGGWAFSYVRGTPVAWQWSRVADQECLKVPPPWIVPTCCAWAKGSGLHKCFCVLVLCFVSCLLCFGFGVLGFVFLFFCFFCFVLCVLGLGLGFGFRVLGFEFRVLAFRVLGLGFGLTSVMGLTCHPWEGSAAR